MNEVVQECIDLVVLPEEKGSGVGGVGVWGGEGAVMVCKEIVARWYGNKVICLAMEVPRSSC